MAFRGKWCCRHKEEMLLPDPVCNLWRDFFIMIAHLYAPNLLSGAAHPAADRPLRSRSLRDRSEPSTYVCCVIIIKMVKELANGKALAMHPDNVKFRFDRLNPTIFRQ